MADPIHFAIPGSLERRTGGYNYDRRIIAGLRELGRTVELLELPGSYPFPAEADLREAETRFVALPDGAPVVVDGLAFGALADLAEKERIRLRLIALVHHPLADETGLSGAARGRLEREEARALRCARHVIVTSAFTRRRLAGYGVAASDIKVVEPGVEPAPICAGRDGGPIRLFCPASYIPRKGHDDLLLALSGLIDLDWRLVCVGDPTLDPGHFSSLIQLRRALGLAERVELGNQVGDAELNALYAVSDAVVLASRYEGFGMVVTEALVRGLPVVTTTGGALAETLPHGAGLASPPGDILAFRANIRTLLTDSRAYDRLREGARAAGAKLPRWSESAAAFERAILGVEGR